MREKEDADLSEFGCGISLVVEKIRKSFCKTEPYAELHQCQHNLVHEKICVKRSG